jgi:hypothetical protein
MMHITHSDSKHIINFNEKFMMKISLLNSFDISRHRVVIYLAYSG